METELICTPENVRDFNAALRAELPAAHALAKALVERGLMDGLRGACIGPPAAQGAGAVPVLSDAAEKRLADSAWARKQGRAA